LGHVVDGSGFVSGVGVREVGVYYPDLALCILPVTFENCDVFGVGGDCAAFEEDERMCVTASRL